MNRFKLLAAGAALALASLAPLGASAQPGPVVVQTAPHHRVVHRHHHPHRHHHWHRVHHRHHHPAGRPVTHP